MSIKNKFYPQVKGHSGSFETYIEIPITIHYDFQPAERQTNDYPGCNAAVCLNAIDIDGKEVCVDIFNYFETNHADSFEQEIWDQMEDNDDA